VEFPCGLSHESENYGALLGVALQLLERVYKHGFIYHKSGVFLTDIVPDTEKQRHLVLRPDDERNSRLMDAVDRINRKHGRHTVRPLAVGFDHSWEMKQARLSPRYTTRVNEVLKMMTR
jgi:DNA polymerase V